MRTWTAATTVDASQSVVLAVLTDPEAVARWAPVPFDVDDDAPLTPGHRTKVRGKLAGVGVGFDVEVLEARRDQFALRAEGPVAIDVRYDLEPAAGGSEVRASVGVRPGRGLRGRVLAEATGALLSAGALQAALSRIATEAAH
jgi:uncharacterized protein YndB with AHSA1/START domain